MAAQHSDDQTLGLQLPPALQLHILSLLDPNDCALSGRLVSPDAAAGLSEPQNCTASLSQPLPPHAVPWTMEAGQQHVRQLSFRHKLQLLCTAAASGSEVNLEVALALLQPSIFPQLLHHNIWQGAAYPNPGVAAVEAGHPQLLDWLLRHCPAWLAQQGEILRAAARHCDLAGLQAVWAALGCGDSTAFSLLIKQDLLAEVAASSVDAEAKVEWVLAEARGSCSLQESTAAAAARSGDLGRLRWLRKRGCPMGLSTLESALQHAHLAVAQWLVDEAGCELLAAVGEEGRWAKLLAAAAKSPDGGVKLQWLRERGALPLGGDSDSYLTVRLLRSAAAAGRVEVVQYLLSIVPPAARQQLVADPDLFHCAVSSGSIPTVEFLRQAGCAVSYAAYAFAARAAAYKVHPTGGDNGAMVRWLVQEARVPAADCNLQVVLREWPSETPADSRDLLQVVQLLVGEAGCSGWEARMALITAARRGDLALVQYLLQQRQRYQPNWEVLVAAAGSGCEALLEWLVEQHPGCLEGPGAEQQYGWPDPSARKEGPGPYVPAATRGDLGTLTALRRLGVPWGACDIVVEAMREWTEVLDLHTLAWGVNGTAAQAVREGCNVPALRWLVEQGAPVGSRDSLEQEVDRALRCDGLRAEDAAWLRSLGPAH